MASRTFLIALGLGVLGGVGTGRTAHGQEAPQHQHAAGMPTVTETGGAPLYENLGSLHYRVTARSAGAQQYFDQGLRLTWAFNHEEAIASYTAATREDSTCAMCWWGIAYALGPNINAPMDTAVVGAAWAALGNAQKHAARATPRERDFIAALAKRYAPDASADRPQLDSAFAKAMGALAKKYPTDPEIQTVYADAIMNLSPWNYYTDRGTKLRPQTAELVATLERTIKRYPDHPGACHLYIHAVEASTTPARAVPCADRLAKLMPGAGHLVHMPSHIYMRTGRYDLVAAHNHDAVGQDERFIQDRKPAGFYKFMYYPHNYHMMYAGLIFLGRGNEAIAAARKIVSVLPAEVTKQVPPLEYFFPTPYWALARFERWDDLLAEPAPAAHQRYATGMWRYGRSLAFAAKGRHAEAKAEHDSVAAIAEATPKEAPAGINSAKVLLQLAERHSAGRLAAAQGDTAGAITAYEAAMKIEDGLVYDEPPAWYHPIRLELGAVKLAQGQPAAAEKLYREDLMHWPNNGWALHGLASSLRAQGKTAEAAKVEAQFRKEWKKADVKLAGR
jgi:tetratricopeptide (TPR) repeat protein